MQGLSSTITFRSGTRSLRLQRRMCLFCAKLILIHNMQLQIFPYLEVRESERYACCKLVYKDNTEKCFSYLWVSLICLHKFACHLSSQICQDCNAKFLNTKRSGRQAQEIQIIQIPNNNIFQSLVLLHLHTQTRRYFS